MIVGCSISGIRSTGSRLSEITPSSVMTPLIMNIVTGRWIAKRGMLIQAPNLLPCGGLAATPSAATACRCGCAAAFAAVTRQHDAVAVAQR